MRCLLQFLPILTFIIFSCAHKPINYTVHGPILEDVDPMTTHLILHIRPEQEIKKSILKMVKDANILFRNANIFILISEIQYDSPSLILDNSGKEGNNSKLFWNISNKEKSHRIHVFFVDEIITPDDEASPSGMYKSFTTCRSMIFVANIHKKNTLAHEIAHVLKLKHRDDKNNVMDSGVRTKKEHFTADQMEKMRNRLARRKILCK